MRSHTTVDSPVGPVTLVDEDGALVGCWMGDADTLPERAQPGRRDDDVQPAAREQLGAYFRGELTAFDLPLALHGTPFQLRVWAALRAIPYGETRSYGELAEEIGQPTAARAVGLANGRNPLGIVVPCHRVVGSGGRLTGYAGGLDRKRWLLDHERGGVLALG